MIRIDGKLTALNLLEWKGNLAAYYDEEDGKFYLPMIFNDRKEPVLAKFDNDTDASDWVKSMAEVKKHMAIV